MGELMKFQLPTKTLTALALTFVLAPVPGSAAQNRSGAVVIPPGYAEKFIAGTPEAPAAVEFIHGKSGGHTRALLLKMPDKTLNDYALEEYKKLGCKTALIDLRKTPQGEARIGECQVSDKYETVDIALVLESGGLLYFVSNGKIKERDLPVLRELSRKKLRENQAAPEAAK